MTALVGFDAFIAQFDQNMRITRSSQNRVDDGQFGLAGDVAESREPLADSFDPAPACDGQERQPLTIG